MISHILDRIIYKIRTSLVAEEILEDSVVCDLGCRKDAGFLKTISKKIKYGYGFDIDIVPDKNLKIEKKFINLENGKIDLRDASVNIVTAIAVLEHLNNPNNMITEASRVLRAGGKLLLTTPSVAAKPILEFLAFKLHAINKQDILEHKNYFSPNDIKKILMEAGFKEESIKIKFFEFGLNQLVIAKK